jgi:uncharacterized protein YbbC (DUF1343 family)
MKSSAIVLAASCLFILASLEGRAAVRRSEPVLNDPADEKYAHLFADTTVPPRGTTFFLDELPPPPAEGKDVDSTDVKKRFEAQAKQAEAISTQSNAQWRAANPQPPVYTPQLKGVRVKLGDERLFDEEKYRTLIRGKRVGLITNATGMDSQFVSTIDKLARTPETTLTVLFAPEHGVRGAQGAGEKVVSGTDPLTGVPVHSLHGRDASNRPQNKPRPSMLRDVDVLIYDIQDIGNRSYTYVGTMKLCMEAAAENGKEFIVLDRPNPLGGELVSGNVLTPGFETLVGWAPVGYLYGLTAGEVALWMNNHYKLGCKLTVVPMKGWKRSMRWGDTGLPWIPTSTHMQVPEACWFIAVTGMLGELNCVNVGVGYPYPFAYVGAPWIDAQRLATELNSRHLPGIFFRPAYFKPYYGPYKDRQCEGVELHLIDLDRLMPVEAGIHVIEAINKLYPEQRILYGGAWAPPATQRERVGAFNKVMGTTEVRRMLLDGKSAEEIIRRWEPTRARFAKEREKYFLYR